MTPDTVLAELEPLTHGDRVRRMIALGRQAGTDTAAAETLRTLAAGGFYERMLALFSCSGSRDGAHVERALSDESRLLRGLATRLAPDVCTDEQLESALTGASRDGQVPLLRGLIRHGRRTAIDVFLDRAASDRDERLGEYLPFGTAEGVRRHLDLVLPRFGRDDWRRLARLHPDIALEALRREAGTREEADARLLSHVNAVLPELADSRTDEALALARDLLRHEPLSRLELQRMAERRPDAVADLLLASEDEAHVNLSGFAHRLSPDRLLALLRHRPGYLPQRHVWLRRLTPTLRRAAYDLAGRGWRTSEGVLDAAVVGLLPGELREKEARRCLALPALATRPAQRLPYAAFLPWEEARGVLDPSVRNPDADLRAVALTALIGTARYQRERLPDVLALVRARANEQDPVRRAMLSALAALPPARWQAGHLDDLSQIIEDALGAADLSPLTASEAEKLVVALVPFHPEWAAPWLGRLAQSRGQVYFYGLGDRLTDADVARIAPALLPVFRSWETREREPFIVAAANSLGRRLRVFDGLADILERVVTTTRQSYVAWQILSLLARHRPDRMRTLVPALLASDASAVTLPSVHEYLHRKRQDLLTPFLGQKAYAGRFSTGRTRFVLPLASGFHRWTPAQQSAFAGTLHQLTRDEARDTPALFRAINQLAALPTVVPSRLIELADRRMQKLAVRDAALRALARLDAGQGIPTLVEALDDDRARIAIYALRTAILEMPADRALALLRSVPTVKVTVAKEVVRLLGELDTPNAYPVLLAMARQAPPPHRDVRVALLRALWDHLERDETWPILNAAAVAPDPAVAAGVVRIPIDRLSPLAQGRLLNLIGTLLDHPDARVRLDTLTRCADLPLPDRGRTLLPRLLARFASPLPDECAAAARAVFATYTGPDAPAVAVAVGAIRDDRRALVAALSALRSSLAGNRVRLQPTVRAVLGALESDPLTASRRAELAVAGLPWEEIAPYLSRLAETNELHAEALMAAVQAIEGSARPDTSLIDPTDFGDSGEWDESSIQALAALMEAARLSAGSPSSIRDDAARGLAAMETELAASEDDRLRRLALAALIAQGTATPGWTPDLRARLDIYRRDPSSLVAAAAQFTLLPPDGSASDGQEAE
jgi:hypothetical protein